VAKLRRIRIKLKLVPLRCVVCHDADADAALFGMAWQSSHYQCKHRKMDCIEVIIMFPFADLEQYRDKRRRVHQDLAWPLAVNSPTTTFTSARFGLLNVPV
jgi:hypothetical protein